MLKITDFSDELATTTRTMDIDFDKMIKVADVLETSVTIEDFTRITTQYGDRFVVKTPNGYMYVNDICAEKIEAAQNHLPLDFYFKKKLKKSAANKDVSKIKDTDYYIICYPQTKRASVKDYLNKEITVISMRTVDTEYGTKYAVVLDDYTEFLTSWSKLYKIFENNRDVIAENGGVSGIWVVEKVGKNGKYCAFATEPPEQHTVKKPIKRPARFSEPSLADPDILF